jgi:Carboxypeptidase regulatory-like domain
MAGGMGARIGVGLVVLVLAAGCVAQERPDVAGGVVPKYRVAGKVVSARDGHGLLGATVRLLDGKQKPVASMVVGEDGGFSFEVAAGRYPMQARMPGYATAYYEQHGELSTAIVTGGEVSTEGLVLELTPSATISGRVTDDHGEPVQRANVTLYTEHQDAMGVRVTRGRGAQTNDLGEYELTGLVPGKYYVSASGMPWYGVHPQPKQQANGMQGMMATVAEGIDPGVDVAFPEIFYPAAMDSSGAGAIAVKGGEQIEVNMNLFAVPAMTLTIAKDPAAKNQYGTALQRTVFGMPEQLPIGMMGTQTENMYTGVPPGTYTVRLMNGPAGGTAKEATVDLTRQSLALDANWGEELGKLKMTMQGADGGKLPAGVQVSAIAKDSGETLRSLAKKAGAPADEWEIDGVSTGEYSFTVRQGAKEYFVEKVMADGKVLPGNAVSATAGGTKAVTLVVGAASGAIEGVAKKDGRPMGGAMVVLVSVEEDGRAQHNWRQQSDLDGHFSVERLPPGRYLALAIEDGWELDWQRTEALVKYLPGAVPVVVPERGVGPVKLKDGVVVQGK